MTLGITNLEWSSDVIHLAATTAVANPDGAYTLVISPTDSGVWNWVSTGGLNQGTISIRFQDLDTNATNLPTVSSQVVTLDQLAAILLATAFGIGAVQVTDGCRAAGMSTIRPWPNWCRATWTESATNTAT